MTPTEVLLIEIARGLETLLEAEGARRELGSDRRAFCFARIRALGEAVEAIEYPKVNG